MKTEVNATKQEYVGKVKRNILLNGEGSNKATFHLEIQGETPYTYQPGDVAGITPITAETELTQIAQKLGLDAVPSSWRDRNFRGVKGRILTKFGEIIGAEVAEEQANIADVIEKYGVHKAVQSENVADALGKISPRLYSISSSADAHEGELHLTVTVNTFRSEFGSRDGFCSSYIASLQAGDEVAFTLKSNPHFKLPTPDKDIIMIGPGTGIAPFRSFLAHRQLEKGSGRNWLIFGEQHEACDYYYKDEITAWQADGTLTILSTAFSRDQAHKIYVQDRIREQGEEFYRWLENGASIYICGQKKPMSEDVETAMTDVLCRYGNLTPEQATAYLKDLRKQGRYQKDVY